MFWCQSTFLGLFLLTVSFLSGCAPLQTSQTASRLQLMPASQPFLQAGEYYIYDQGTAAMVTDSRDGNLLWHIGDRGQVVSSQDFFLPWLEWQEGQIKYQSSITSVNGSLWPLSPGKKMDFAVTETATGTDAATLPKTVQRTWQCLVGENQQVSVPAGTFASHEVICKRYSGEDGNWRGTERYYYAPEIGHFVKLEREHPVWPKKIYSLQDYGFATTRLPATEQGQLLDLLTRLLERGKPGETVVWQSQSKKAAAILALSGQQPTSAQCRIYSSTFSVQGRQSSHQYQLCRNSKGQWEKTSNR